MFDSYQTRNTIPTTTRNMAGSPYLNGSEKKHWWLNNRKIVDKYVKLRWRNLIARQEQSEIASALNLFDAALALSPRFEVAIEMKARSAISQAIQRRIVDMLQDYFPSLKMGED